PLRRPGGPSRGRFCINGFRKLPAIVRKIFRRDGLGEEPFAKGVTEDKLNHLGKMSGIDEQPPGAKHHLARLRTIDGVGSVPALIDQSGKIEDGLTNLWKTANQRPELARWSASEGAQTLPRFEVGGSEREWEKKRQKCEANPHGSLTVIISGKGQR